MDMVKVQLKEEHNARKNGSTFYFEGQRYVLTGSAHIPVPRVVANAWKAADSNVIIMP